MNEKQLREELDAVYASLSWKITAPLRHLSAALRQYIIRPSSPRFYLHHLGLYVLRRPRLLRCVESLTASLPSLHHKVLRFKERAEQQTKAQLLEQAQKPVADHFEAMPYPQMNANARLIHGELTRLMEKKV